MKWQTLILMLMLIPLALAAETDICEGTLPSGRNCTMITPAIICTTYNYTTFNQTNLVTEGNLTLLNSSIYYFVFNESQGDYIVKLCDDSTREIIVEMEDEMIQAIIITICIFGVLFIVLGVIILLGRRNDTH